MDSPFANKAFAEQIGVTFPLLSDWGGQVTKAYGIYNENYMAPRRVSYLIDTDGVVTQMQFDREAVDPTALVGACGAEPVPEPPPQPAPDPAKDAGKGSGAK